jgi:hypothetical protein
MMVYGTSASQPKRMICALEGRAIVTTCLGDLHGSRRINTLALRSLFASCKETGMIFRDPTSRIKAGQREHTDVVVRLGLPAVRPSPNCLSQARPLISVLPEASLPKIDRRLPATLEWRHSL